MNCKKIPILIGVISLIFSGCKRNKIETYRIPKSVSQAEQQAPAMPAMDTPTRMPATPASPGFPAFTWDFPSTWTEQSGTSAMRLASYTTPGGGDFSIVQLPDSDDLSNVNRWLRQLGREPITQAELGSVMQHMDLAGRHVHVFQLEGNPGDDRAMLAAILREDGRAWFFKLDGTRQAIADARPDFLAVLDSTRAAPGAETASTAPPSASPAMPPPAAETSGNMQVLPGMREQVSGIPDATWQAPDAWREAEGSAIRKGTYRTPGGAELAITAFPGDVGGLEANINRWRRQIGLPPAGPDEMAAFTQSMEIDGYPGTLMYFAASPNDDAANALLGLIVELGQASWFFKMTGPAAVLESERARFEQFAGTISFSN